MRKHSLLLLFSFFLAAHAVHAAEWQQILSAESSFADSVDTDGDVLVAGAPAEVVDGDSLRGAAYVYVRQDGAWQQAARLIAADGDIGHRFGWKVEAGGDTVVISAPRARVDGITEAGAVYVFERDTNGAWNFIARLQADDPTTMARFGTDIGIDGDRIAVAAPRADEELGEDAGAVYVFDRANGDWQQSAKLKRSGGFGTAVDVSGDTVAIGTEGGMIFPYVLDDGNWSSTMPVHPTTFDNGIIVKLEGDVLAVAAPGAGVPDRPWIAVGRVFVFQRNNTVWDEVAALEDEDAYNLGMFGQGMDMQDGLIAAATGYETSGFLSIFMPGENGEWQHVHRDAGPFPRISRQVAISAETVIAGGSYDDGGMLSAQATSVLLATDEETESADDSDDSGDGTGNESGDDDNNTVTGGDDSEATEDPGNDERAGDSGDNGDETGGGETSGAVLPAADSGGGAMSGAFALLLLLARCRRLSTRIDCQRAVEHGQQAG